MDSHENIIEWLNGDKTARATFTQQKFINRIERMSEKYGDRVKILHKNEDLPQLLQSSPYHGTLLLNR